MGLMHQNLSGVSEACRGFFSSEPDCIFRGKGRNVFSRGKNSLPPPPPPFLKIFLPHVQNTQEEGGRISYYILRETSFGVCPLWNLFPSGAELYYFEFYHGQMLLMPHSSTRLWGVFICYYYIQVKLFWEKHTGLNILFLSLYINT